MIFSVSTIILLNFEANTIRQALQKASNIQIMFKQFSHCPSKISLVKRRRLIMNDLENKVPGTENTGNNDITEAVTETENIAEEVAAA